LSKVFARRCPMLSFVRFAFYVLPAISAAPPPEAGRLPQKIESEARAAEEANRFADRLHSQILDQLPLPLSERAELRERHRQAVGDVARRYTRLVKLLGSLKELSPDQRKMADDATFKAAEAWIIAGDSGKA